MGLPTKNISKMKKLVFATGNEHKIREVAAILKGAYEIVPMKDIGCKEDIPETSPTLEGNALQKARYLKEHYQVDCFSEDTGLEIDALNGAPGVITARYAGLPRSSANNMDLVLQKLLGSSNRKARFRTVIALIMNKEEHIFEGIVEGSIADSKSGIGGFGYDPIFIPDGYDQTFAVLPEDIKHQISHRARAMAKLIDFLEK
ncbi:MAG: XTP/dITP diphosphohydrolase [Saprospiraceae bacterium]|jgi:XTP/dITP diphosphohydrolase